MGVNQLWSILAPVKTHKTLKSLKGQTIVVDLSVWICESSSALQGLPVAKPHLRNLFFRVINLTKLGVNLIFVLDGEPPELKWDEMERRTNARLEGGARGRLGHWRSKQSKPATGDGAVTGNVKGVKKKQERKRFKFVVKECEEMLQNLGVPCVQAEGEAEAMCALMNVKGVADACLTEDGDVFLYGARTVYKNFTLNTKDPHIECYSMDDIESQLGLDQSKLIALGLLLGCDYTLGVPGVGPKQATGLMRQLGSGVNVLDRFRDWANGKIPRECLQQAPKKSPHCARCSHLGPGREHKVFGCAMCDSDVACHPKTVNTPECSCLWHVSAKTRGKPSLEPDVMKKACAIPDFPSERVIDEFLSAKNKCPNTKLVWRRPQLISAQKFVVSKLEWPEDYTVEKVFPLVTLWDLTAISSGQSFNPKLHLTPTAVIKKRVRQGVACVEVQWKTGIPHSNLEFPTTIEKEELFAKAFPELMTVFEETKAVKTKQKRKKAVKDNSESNPPDSPPPTIKEDDLDGLASAVGELSLISHPYRQQDDNKSSLRIVNFQDHSDLSDLSEAEDDCSSLPLSLYQRLQLSPKSRVPRSNHISNSDVTDSLPADKFADEAMNEAVGQHRQRSQSVLGCGFKEVKPVIKTSNNDKMRSFSDACGIDVFQDLDLTFPDLSFSTSIAQSKPLTSITQELPIRNINVKPLHRKPSPSNEITSTSKGTVSCSSVEADDVDAEPLPLSERLRLKKAVETITLDDSSCSSSTDDEATSYSTSLVPVTVTSLAEKSELINTSEVELLHESSFPLVEEIANTSASSQVDGSCSVSPFNSEDANFNLGFELTKMLSNDDTLLETEEFVSHSIFRTLHQKASRIEHSCSSEVRKGKPEEAMQFVVSPSLQKDPLITSNGGDYLELPTSTLHTGQKELFAEHSAKTECSVLRETINLCESSPVQPELSLTLNFSLKFELTNILNEDESLLQRKETSEVENAKLDEVTNILNEDGSLLQRNETSRVEDAKLDEKSELRKRGGETDGLLVGGECREMFLTGEDENTRFGEIKEEKQKSLQGSLRFSCKSDVKRLEDASTVEANKNKVDDPEEDSIDFKEKLRYFLQQFEDRNERLEKKKNCGEDNCCELEGIVLPDDDGESDVQLFKDDNLVLNYGDLNSESPHLPTCDREKFSSKTPAGTVCRKFAPLPVHGDTLVVDDESFLGVFNQSKPARLRAGQNGQPITTPVSLMPRKFQHMNISRTNQGACYQSLSGRSNSHSGTNSHCEQSTSTANQKPERFLNNQLESVLHEVENSPAPLLDRLRRKHGIQDGVVSAALRMKNISKFSGKQEQHRKVLMEIFDDGNENDTLVF